MSFLPKVSIVIPVYNGSDYLSEAIDSALLQTYPEIEIIVVNDGSDDGDATEQIALTYGEKIRYFSKENGGVASALNFGIGKMTGDYFSWLSHDDLYYQDKIEAQIQLLAKHVNERVIAYGDFSVFSDDINKTRAVHLPEVSQEAFRYFLTIDSSLHGCTLLIPKMAFVECGLFREDLRTTQDYELWFRMCEKYRFVHVPKLLVKARHHAAQGSIKMKKIALAECNTLQSYFISRLSADEVIAASGKEVGVAYADIAASCYKRGLTRAAHDATRIAIREGGRAGFSDVAKLTVAVLRTAIVGEAINGLRRIRNLL